MAIDQFGNIYIGSSGNNGSFDLNDRRWVVTKVDGMDGSLRWVEAGTSINHQENSTNGVYVATNGNV
jgi:hypothetical protein